MHKGRCRTNRSPSVWLCPLCTCPEISGCLLQCGAVVHGMCDSEINLTVTEKTLEGRHDDSHHAGGKGVSPTTLVAQSILRGQHRHYSLTENTFAPSRRRHVRSPFTAMTSIFLPPATVPLCLKSHGKLFDERPLRSCQTTAPFTGLCLECTERHRHAVCMINIYHCTFADTMKMAS